MRILGFLSLPFTDARGGPFKMVMQEGHLSFHTMDLSDLVFSVRGPDATVYFRGRAQKPNASFTRAMKMYRR